MYAYLWMTDEQLGGSNNFTVVGGVNAAACKIKPKICAKFQAEDIYNKRWQYKWMKNLIKESKKTVILNPFRWSYYKLPYLFKYWFKEGGDTARTKIIVINSILLVLIFGVIAIALMGKTTLDMVCCLMLFSILLGTIIPHFIIHFEARYLYPMKIFSYITFVIVLINFICNKKKKSEFAEHK
ncbi:MAG: hypothetical protein HRU36_04440 [Rickettsiales bacterium]|nr:hypothetical protein [Rickettsiales bacterium]